MKNLTAFGIILLMSILIFTQCETNTTEPEVDLTENQEELTLAMNEVNAMDQEIEFMEDSALTDIDTARVKRRLWIALDRLDAMLDRVRIVLIAHPNDSARVLFDQARDAKHNAIEAVRIDSFALAVDYIHESRFLAIEAMKIIRNENIEQLEAMIARLRDKMGEVDILLDEVRTLLEVTPNERAEFLYNRGRRHQGIAVVEFADQHYRRTAYHLLRAGKYARRAMFILTGE